MKITDDIQYIGVNDHTLDLFEGQYAIPNGISYNSYVILDDQIAVLDTVDAHYGDQWLAQLAEVLGGREPDYLIVHHMEPDHSANILRFLELYPDTKILAGAKAFPMMQQFFGIDLLASGRVVKENDTLCLGRHTLTFFAAPMIHWPEVIMSYDDCDKVLFTADAFGTFGALDTLPPEITPQTWAEEARRYYIGIVGKYGAQVQTLLKKISPLEIRKICSLHGPVLDKDLPEYLHLYDLWSSYQPETKGVMIACASIYGNTMRAVEELAGLLRDAGTENVAVYDLDRCEMSEAVAEAFRYDRVVLACSTYNGHIFPFMETFLNHLTAHNFQNRTVAFIENGSWAPNAARTMARMLEGCKNLTIAEPTVTIRSALNEDSEKQLKELAKALAD